MATPKKSHWCFTIALKLQVVETAERISKPTAAKTFDVDPKQICEWCKQKDELLRKKAQGIQEEPFRQRWKESYASGHGGNYV